MEYQSYDVLGVMPSATRQEIDDAYNKLKAQYQQDRFQVGQAGEDAAEKLQSLEVAYRDISSLWEVNASKTEADAQSGNGYTTQDNSTSSYDGYDDFDEYSVIKQCIKDNNLDKAQQLLDEAGARTGEWHYLQSVIFYKNNWFLESKKQLEFAISLEPNNQRYIDSLDKLNKIISSNTISADDLRTTSTGTGATPYASNGTCTGSTCGDCLMCNMCCNCMSCMGGC